MRVSVAAEQEGLNKEEKGRQPPRAAAHRRPIVGVARPMHSVWLDTAKGRALLGWGPGYGAIRLASEAFACVRADDDIREVFYPG